MKEETKTLISCIVKTTLDYWKKMCIAMIIVGGICLTVLGAEKAATLFIDPCYNAIVSIPPLDYAISAVVIIPILLATIVCYHNRDKRRIEKEDKEFTCSE